MTVIQGKGNALVQMRRLVNKPNGMMLGVVVSVDTVTITTPGTPATGGGYPTYRYWKLDILSNNGSQFTALQEVELIGEGGTDVTTPSTPVTASTYYAAMGNVAVNTVDNSYVYEANDCWTSDGTSTSDHLIYDLGTPTALTAVKLMAQTWLVEMELRAPNTFNICGSADGTAWTVVKAVTNATGYAMQEFKTFTLDAASGSSGTPDTTVTTTGAIAGVDIRGTVYAVSTSGFTLSVGDSVMVANGAVQRKLSGTLGVNTSNIITQIGG